MEYITTDDERVSFKFEGIKNIEDDVEYSISGMFRGDNYNGHIQFLWKPKGRKANVVVHTGKEFLYADRVSKITTKMQEDGARDVLKDYKDQFSKIRDEIDSGDYPNLKKMLDDIDSLLY